MARPTPMSFRPGLARSVAVAAGSVAGLLVSPAQAVTPAKEGASAPIYSCVDANGRRLSSDRPIPECLSQEQNVLGKDGTVRKKVPPLLSPEQQSQKDAERAAQARAQAARMEQVRNDRLLLSRYPTLAAHDQARQRALESTQKAIDTIQVRIAQLETERVVLANERANQGFKAVPENLKMRTNANDGSLEAQRTLLHSMEAERARINLQYDNERQRLALLLAGLPPGAQVDAGAPAAPTSR
ncbi:DUF4124 domain-containing protein [Ideonella oryzae]|uniref:DUF4124 domain-containing protein n=1 Tax=Ideonella oryzae TaxID=2937441 RepID=A0ABT1BNP4_9BURK|nr:DUF4124 domain-containing protein [Ideonella oryzae]MCO5977554.1 DUF4124 domain-containing protein [Ideonella oryzae]